MNMIRMIAIALPMTLLLACGGGGGGTAAAPNTPTTPITPTPQALPVALIDAEAARNRIAGDDPASSPTSPTSTAIQTQQTFQSRIMDANTLVASDAYVVSSTTPNGATVSTNGGVIIDGNTHRVSLEEVQMGVADWFDLTRFNSRYAPVMDHRGVTLAEYRAAGRNGSDVYEYQSYGGWLMESAFSVDMLTINDGPDDESSLLVGISYGDASGSRPSGLSTSWRGLMVGMSESNGDVIQGEVTVIVTDNSGANIDLIGFSNVININNGSSSSASWNWVNVTVESDGTFSSTTGGDVDGAFYGTGHTEVGGTFNRNGIIGAFGGTRQ